MVKKEKGFTPFGYERHKFSNKQVAIDMQKEMKKAYGYKPALFKIENGKEVRYAIIRPKGLVKI